MNVQEIVLSEVAEQSVMAFPNMITQIGETEGCYTLITMLTPQFRREFLKINGDQNVFMHHPDKGMGNDVVQGLVWMTICNAAMSRVAPGAMMVWCEFNACDVTYGGGSNVPVKIEIEVKETGRGELSGVCRIFAPRRPRGHRRLAFEGKGKTQLRRK